MMPRKQQFKQALILAAGGAILVGTQTGAAHSVDAKKPPNGKIVQAKGLDWEKKPPNG